MDLRAIDYSEDGGTRVVAEIDAILERRGDQARVRVLVKAQGPRVMPDPGMRGVPGHNRHTAMELADMLYNGELAIGGRWQGEAQDGDWDRGTVRVADRRTMPERKVWGNGTIDYGGRTAARLPVEVEFAIHGIGQSPESPPTTASGYEVRLMARGVPRLRLIVDPDRQSIGVAEGLDRFGRRSEVGQ